MIARLPSVVVLVWLAIPAGALAVAAGGVSGLLAVVTAFAFLIVARVVHDDRAREEEERRRTLRDAAQRAEIAEHRRGAPDWSWPRAR